jgi:hypothetical protein
MRLQKHIPAVRNPIVESSLVRDELINLLVTSTAAARVKGEKDR